VKLSGLTYFHHCLITAISQLSIHTNTLRTPTLNNINQPVNQYQQIVFQAKKPAEKEDENYMHKHIQGGAKYLTDYLLLLYQFHISTTKHKSMTMKMQHQEYQSK